jgi:H+/Cl- antiporter ClcA
VSEPNSEIKRASTTEGLPISTSIGPILEAARVPPVTSLVDARVVAISGLSVLLAVAAGLVAQGLTRLIGFVTNLAFYGRVSWAFISPADNHLGLWVIPVPIIGGLIVGLMARFGSKAIRGHGIPEAMEQVLTNKSRIPARLTFLKPLSAAIAIGTGGPFGAEGPIIATGGALGSLIGQVLETTALERKTLLSAGAAAGMAATFGSPVSAVLLAVELLLFEYRPRSLIPVALAAATATGVRIAFVGAAPIFPMPGLLEPSGAALAGYIVLGALVGLVSVWVTGAVYWVEDGFERLPIHWMWWPALGAVAVGVIGYFVPHTLGVGYDNIEKIVSGRLLGQGLIVLCAFKLISWAIALGSGTSGGTLAPLFTIGGGLGSALGGLTIALFPGLGLDVRLRAHPPADRTAAAAGRLHRGLPGVLSADAKHHHDREDRSARDTGARGIRRRLPRPGARSRRRTWPGCVAACERQPSHHRRLDPQPGARHAAPGISGARRTGEARRGTDPPRSPERSTGQPASAGADPPASRGDLRRQLASGGGRSDGERGGGAASGGLADRPPARHRHPHPQRSHRGARAKARGERARTGEMVPEAHGYVSPVT